MGARSWILRAIARALAPDVFEDAEKFHWLIGNIRNDRWWFGEFPDLHDGYERLVFMTHDNWRALGEKPVATYPTEISQFRERLRQRRAATTTQGEA